MKSWHKHCTKKSQVQEARWAPQNRIWGALPGKWCENDALDADWLNFQGVKFSIARIQENIELHCAENLNNQGLTRSKKPFDAELDFKYVQSGANDGTFSTSECHLQKASTQIDITGTTMNQWEWTLSWRCALNTRSAMRPLCSVGSSTASPQWHG